MERPTITIEGKKYEMAKLTGRSWRVLAESSEAAPNYADADFIEQHAAFIAKFFDGVTVEDILEMPLEEILPTSAAIKKYVMEMLTAKFERLEKNSEAEKAQ